MTLHAQDIESSFELFLYRLSGAAVLDAAILTVSRQGSRRGEPSGQSQGRASGSPVSSRRAEL